MKKFMMSLVALSITALAGCAVTPEQSEEGAAAEDMISEEVADEGLEEVAEVSQEISTCGTGLYCYWTAYKGTTACLSNGNQVNCCPFGYSMAGGSCVPHCGTGLSCGYSSSWPSGSNICTQNNGNTNPVYCCAPGKTFTANGCI